MTKRIASIVVVVCMLLAYMSIAIWGNGGLAECSGSRRDA